MAERTTRLRLGLFTATCLAALVALVILFGGTPTVFVKRARYTVLFPEAPGVAVGTPVRKSGVRIGQVTRVDLDEGSGQVRVGIELDPKYPPRKTEEATITRGLLNGDTALDFIPRSERNVTVPERGDSYDDNAEILGVAPISPRSLLRDATEALPNAQESVARVVNSIARFEAAVPKVERAIDEIAGLARGGREFVPELRQTNIKVQNLLGQAEDPKGDPKDPPANLRVILQQILELLQAVRPVADDLRELVKLNGPELTRTLAAVRRTAESANDVLNPENRKAVGATIKNFQDGSGDLVKTIRIAALLIDQVERTVKEINARVAQAEPVIASAGRAADNLDRATRPLAENSASVIGGAGESLKNLNNASDQLTKLLASINRGEGTVGKAITDPALYNNLNDTTANVARLLARVDKIAKDLEVFADKVARRPETVGVGGALRPSTGLKDPPNNPLPPGATPPIAPQQTAPPAGTPTVAPLSPIAPVPYGPPR